MEYYDEVTMIFADSAFNSGLLIEPIVMRNLLLKLMGFRTQTFTNKSFHQNFPYLV